MSKLPFDLDIGIRFEDSGKILKWKTDFEQLKSIDTPIIRSNETTSLLWQNKICFGGLELNILIQMDELRNNTGKLEHVSFGQIIEPIEAYKKNLIIFKSNLGEPSYNETDGYGYPISKWNFENLEVVIGVAERFVDYQIFAISYVKND